MFFRNSTKLSRCNFEIAFSLLIIKIDENNNLVKAKGSFTDKNNIDFNEVLEKGKYIINPIYLESTNAESFGYTLSVSADNNFALNYMGVDNDNNVLKNLVINHTKKKHEEMENKQACYQNLDFNLFEEANIHSKIFANFSKSSYKVLFIQPENFENLKAEYNKQKSEVDLHPGDIEVLFATCKVSDKNLEYKLKINSRAIKDPKPYVIHDTSNLFYNKDSKNDNEKTLAIIYDTSR